MKNKLSKNIRIDTPFIFAPWGLLFGNGKGYITPNQYQSVFCTKDLCAKNSEGSVN
jgi:hypothetical protein